MRVCLIPLKIETKNPQANLQRLKDQFAKISSNHPDLVCLPECTLTGYLSDSEEIEHFAETIPGFTTQQMAQLAKANNTWVCFGLLELGNPGIYNSAVLLDRNGNPMLRHRKIEESFPFAKGQRVESIDTEWGRLSILICGDLFNEIAIRQVGRSTDLLVLPMARSFDKRSPDVERWLREERQAYLDAVKTVGVSTTIVNALDDTYGYFGGAMVVDANGELVAESPHGTDEILGVELGNRNFRTNNKED